MIDFRTLNVVFGATLLLTPCGAFAQATVTARVDLPVEKSSTHTAPPSAVLWLEPVSADLGSVSWPPHSAYRLLQKNRTFSPHVLVVPVGASVAFPNADTYFHNVFSLFEGSRFDLGLYEAGSTRDVQFTRRGISYIFCNIHPEMGAVVISLSTPLWSMIKGNHTAAIPDVPSGTYDVHLWVEGQDTALLTRWKHTLTVPATGMADAGTFHGGEMRSGEHMDKFGRQYKKDARSY